MMIDSILAAIDQEIELLQQARALLTTTPSKKAGSAPAGKRKVSAAVRKRMGAAQSARWDRVRADRLKK